MIESILKQIDLTAKLGQDGSPLQAMNALRIIRETIAKHAAVHPTRSEGERKLSDLGNELHNLPCSLAHDNEEWAEQLSSIARELWSWPQPSPAQAERAEAERPEVVGYLATAEHPKHGQPHKAFNYFKDQHDAQVAHWRERGCEVSDDELMTVAQHERIVKAWIERWKAYIELSAKIAAQRDAAQAEVEALRAELQSQRERNTELIFKLGSATNGWGRCEKERDAAQARCAELKAELAMANDAAAKGDAARHQCAGMEMEIKELRGAAEHWEAESRALQKLLDAALAKLAELEKQEPVAAVSEETFSANGTSDIITRNLPIGTTLYAAPVAPAQHSVPQAWLDVQAERRRQITAEGWTPEHDDGHACDEIAAFACYYAMPPAVRDWDASSTGYGDTLGKAVLPEGWEPKTGDRRRELVKACALALAEIERLDRAADKEQE